MGQGGGPQGAFPPFLSILKHIDPFPLQTVDEALKSKTYVAGETLTAGDLGVFAAIHPYIVRSSLSSFRFSRLLVPL